jgi:ribosomal protein L32
VCANIIDALDYMEKQWDLEQAPTAAKESSTHHHHQHRSCAALTLSSHAQHDVLLDVVRHWFPHTLMISPCSGCPEKDFIAKTTSGTTQLHYRLSYPHLQIMPTDKTADLWSHVCMSVHNIQKIDTDHVYKMKLKFSFYTCTYRTSEQLI